MKLNKLILTLGALAISTAANAGVVSVFDNSWTQLSATSEDDLGYVNKVNPGWGGQRFDAEYLFYKLEGNTLTVGLQTGYDISGNGVQAHGSRDYFAGDLALSFDGVGTRGTAAFSNTFEYAIDFGFKTQGYRTGALIDADNNGDGVDVAGLYSVDAWNNDIYFNSSSNINKNSAPYGMDEGTRLKGVNFVSGSPGSETFSETEGGTTYNNLSHYRTASFDISSLDLGNQFQLDAHWTMSCGNDAVDGGDLVEVPEPSSFVLLAFGMIGLVALRRKNG